MKYKDLTGFMSASVNRDLCADRKPRAQGVRENLSGLYNKDKSCN